MNRWKKLLFTMGAVAVTSALQAQTPIAPPPHPVMSAVADGSLPGAGVTTVPSHWATEAGCAESRGLFQSDRAFSGFIGPISNPILSKDPRSLTEARLLFINNQIPDDHPLGGGDFQVYAMQVRVALTERLTLIADKDGYASINPGRAPSTDGFLNINLGLKYTFVRDVENQFLWAAGFTFEPPTGEADVFQNHGNGVMTVFTTAGKEFGDGFHLLGTFGYQFGIDGSKNSDFFYTSLHLDKQIGIFYPLIELNWFGYTAGGQRGLPPVLGEGDGLLNLGTTGVKGNNLVTFAVGGKVKLGDYAEAGAAWEFPLSSRKDLIDNRLVVDLILRY